MLKHIKGFREFVWRGNVIELAVAVVLAGAFANITKALLDNIITPLISALFGKPNLDNVGVFFINHSKFSIGAVLTAALYFVLVAAAIYFIIIVPMTIVQERFKRGAEPEAAAPAPSEEVLLLQEIRDLLAQRRDV